MVSEGVELDLSEVSMHTVRQKLSICSWLGVLLPLFFLAEVAPAQADRFDACNSANRSCRKACENVATTVIEQGGGNSFDVDACLNVCAVNQKRCTEKVEAQSAKGSGATAPKKQPGLMDSAPSVKGD